MSFKQIGIPARKVIAEAELAARGHDGAHKLVAGCPGGADNPPIAQAFGEGPMASKLDEVAGKRGDAAQPGDGASRRTTGGAATSRTANDTHMRAVLRLVSSRGMSTAHRRQLGVPAPAVLRPMLLLVGGSDHASTG